jgi:DNA polymerase III subunit epsilon
MELKLTKPLAFIDLETTGINIVTDRIVEICIHKVMPDETQQTYTQRINPTIHIPAEVTAIHGISDDDVKDCPTFKDLSVKINQILSQCDIAGYNSNKFDVPFLIEEFLRAGIDFDLKGRRFVDIQNIFHKMEQRTLKAAYMFYCNKDLENAHSAEADTLATFEVLKAQLERYSDTTFTDKDKTVSVPIINDVQALHDFSFHAHFADFVGHIVFNAKGVETFNFGKHKGKPVEDVFKIEPSYYDWMIKADFPLYTKKLITAIKLRGFNKSSVNINS